MDMFPSLLWLDTINGISWVRFASALRVTEDRATLARCHFQFHGSKGYFCKTITTSCSSVC